MKPVLAALLVVAVVACGWGPGGPPPGPEKPPPDEPPAGPDEARIRRALGDRHKLDRAGIAALGGYGPAAFPLYARILDDPKETPYVVARTLVILADPDMKGDRGPLLDRAATLLTHSHIGPRLEAVHLIGAVGTARDAAPVVAMLWDERREVTFAAAKALAAVGDRRAADAMDVWLKRGNHRGDENIRQEVERCRADLLDRLKKEEDAKKAKPPAK